MIECRAVVYGIVRFPEHPEHEGAHGLVGGEDVTAERRTFASAGQAMTWARKVLDGTTRPRVIPAGDLLEPHEGPCWNEARVYYHSPIDDDLPAWLTYSGRRTWHAFRGDRVEAEVARTDWDAA